MSFDDLNCLNTCMVYTKNNRYWVNEKPDNLRKIIRNWQFVGLPTLLLVKEKSLSSINQRADLNIICEEKWLITTDILSIKEYADFKEELEKTIFHEKQIIDQV